MKSMAGARRHWLIWAAVVPVAMWTLIRVLGLDRGFPVVPLMAFTPYMAVAALLVAGVAVALRNWAAAAVTGVATLCLAAAVLPRAVGDGTADAAGHETLTVLSTNVYRGHADPDAVIALVDRYQPDLLNVQELTPGFARKLRAAGIYERLPHRITEVSRGAAGGGMFSRLPLRPLDRGRPSFFRMPRAELRLPDGRRVRVIDVHPLTPSRNGIEAWRDALEDFPSGGRGAPWILAGDFNATLDHSELRDLLDRGYRDAGEVAGQGLTPTWPRDSELGPLITIDHVLADRRLGVVEYAVDEMPGSDHRAIHAVVALP
jgi:endonuclease/exonuclease/phosphatase (EEP) superfamily protein YafD